MDFPEDDCRLAIVDCAFHAILEPFCARRTAYNARTRNPQRSLGRL